MSDSAMGRARRWAREVWRRGPAGGRAVDSESDALVVVVSGYDDIESCSAALERGAGAAPVWTADRQALLRHPMVVPASAVAEIAAIGAQEGYGLVEPMPGVPAAVVGELGTEERLVILARSQVLDALHCSQERSRMAGLAQRHGGRALGWDALQPDPRAGASR